DPADRRSFDFGRCLNCEPREEVRLILPLLAPTLIGERVLLRLATLILLLTGDFTFSELVVVPPLLVCRGYETILEGGLFWVPQTTMHSHKVMARAISANSVPHTIPSVCI